MKPPVLLRCLAGLIALFVLTQCQKVNPQSPKAEGFDIPLVADTSYVTGSITFRLKELEDKINRELDPVLVGNGSASGKRGGVFPFRVTRSGRVQIRYENQQVKFSTPLELRFIRPFSTNKTPAGKPFCSLQVNFQSPLQVTSNWRLASQVKFTDYEWVIKPEIRLLGREISLVSVAQQLLERYQPAIESAINAAIYKELRLDQIVKPIWQDMQKPLLIDKQYGLWLLPKPVGVEASPISGDQGKLTTHLRIALNSQTRLQPTPPVNPLTQLPMLRKREHLPETSDLHLLSFIPYTDINRVLNQTLPQQKKKLALGMLTIQNASVYGGQRSIIVKTQVSGLLDGTIYLRGRPAFDTTTNTLMVNNLDFDAETDDIIPNLTGSLVHDSLLKVVKKLLTIQLGNDIAQLPKKINDAFEKGGAGQKTDLSIKSFRFVPQSIAIRPDGIQVLIRVRSRVGLQVNQL